MAVGGVGIRLGFVLAWVCLLGPLACRSGLAAAATPLGFCPGPVLHRAPSALGGGSRGSASGLRAGALGGAALGRRRAGLPAPSIPLRRSGCGGPRMMAGFEVTQAPLYVGGVGRFMRSPEYLQTIIDELEEELEEELLPALRETEAKVLPKEEELRVLQQKYDETENEIFRSQIRPIELKIRPFQELRKEQLKDVEGKEKEIATVAAVRDQARERHVAEGVVDVEYAGFGDKIWPVEMQRGMGWGVGDEVELTVSGGGAKGYAVSAKWASRLETQPLLVEAEAGRPGLVLSFATPDEGPKRLCAVAEWAGETKGGEVEKKRKEMLVSLKKDSWELTEATALRLATFSDPVPFKRRNEIWFAVVPPEGAGWYTHGAKIATDRVAKNSSVYQLKDCPWGVVRAFASDAGYRQPAGGDAVMALEWSVNTLMTSNTLQCTAPGEGAALAIDKSSTGEVALSLVFERGEEAGPVDADELENYGVGTVEGWPLTAQNVERARQALLDSIQQSGLQALDPKSFRVLVQSSSEVKMWMKLQR